MDKFNLLIEHLYQYHCRSWKGRIVVYALTFTIALVYASINGLMLGRPERSVALESALLTAILLIGLPIVYIIVVINRQSSTAKMLIKVVMDNLSEEKPSDTLPNQIADVRAGVLHKHESKKTA